ncbi:MAG: GNAT family N-acetyltransferase [Rhodospirillales bacterium]|nr:MAG: GNAT family N-acetyltransferase [Rhodospirillales bacterium]
MIPDLETPRLRLRALTLDDAAATQLLFPHWEVVRHLNARVPWPYPDDGALNFYLDVELPAMARGEHWTWAIRLKDGADHHIGVIGLMAGENDNRAFWLALPWHGQGLMTEACGPVTEFWFGALGFERLRIPKAVANTASRRVSVKQGMRVVATEDRDFVEGRLPAEIWELTRGDWNAGRRA